MVAWPVERPRGGFEPARRLGAMMAVPLIVGLAMRPQPALHPYLQAGCFVVGYFAFHAASQWLKSTPRRRARYQAALATYLSGSAILGLGALASGGTAMLGWVPVFVALILPTLWLARQRRERAGDRRRADHGRRLPDDPGRRVRLPVQIIATWPDARSQVLIAGALFGYFFGTVLHVKSLIRERGNSRVEAASLSWHLAWTIAALPLRGWTSGWAWFALFAMATGRTVLLPRFGHGPPAPSRADRRDRDRAQHRSAGLRALGCAALTPLAAQPTMDRTASERDGVHAFTLPTCELGVATAAT
ncbi:MAG: YwiC-like family protein [Micropruina sp.]